jgi:hypothetical protein
MSDHKPRR